MTPKFRIALSDDATYRPTVRDSKRKDKARTLARREVRRNKYELDTPVLTNA